MTRTQFRLADPAEIESRTPRIGCKLDFNSVVVLQNERVAKLKFVISSHLLLTVPNIHYFLMHSHYFGVIIDSRLSQPVLIVQQSKVIYFLRIQLTKFPDQSPSN